ncbi:hypothetical protein E4U53_004964, partial [Claviceps sorghi]
NLAATCSSQKGERSGRAAVGSTFNVDGHFGEQTSRATLDLRRPAKGNGNIEDNMEATPHAAPGHLSPHQPESPGFGNFADIPKLVEVVPMSASLPR